MYRIHILTNDEFDNLPREATRGSDVSDSLGFANKYTGDAYVRATASGELNQYLISHELEELVNSSSAHEDENGIRHKKGKNAFDVLQWIPVVNMIAAPIGLASGKGAKMGLLGTFGGKKEEEQAPQPQGGQFGGFSVSGESASPRVPSGAVGAGDNVVSNMNQGFGSFDRAQGAEEGYFPSQNYEQYNQKRNYFGGF